MLDGRLDGPAPLAGVLGVAAQLRQVVVLLQCVDHEVEQPGADHGALLPAGDDGRHVGDDVGSHHQLPALGVGLHEAVLDAVVDHLGEVAGADLAGVHEAGVALGLQDVEERLDHCDVRVLAAAHQRVALGQAPHAPAHAAVDEADALLGQLLAVAHVVGVARVAAVDDHVARLQQLGQRVDRVEGRRTGRDHHPHGPRRRQLVDQRLERVHLPAAVGRAVVADHLVAAAAQPFGHVAAHLAQADHAQRAHACPPVVGSGHRVRPALPADHPDSRTGISR